MKKIQKSIVVFLLFIFVTNLIALNSYSASIVNSNKPLDSKKQIVDAIASAGFGKIDYERIKESIEIVNADVTFDGKNEMIVSSDWCGLVSVVRKEGSKYKVIFIYKGSPVFKKALGDQIGMHIMFKIDRYKNLIITTNTGGTGIDIEGTSIIRWNGKAFIDIWSDITCSYSHPMMPGVEWNDFSGKISITGKTPEKLVYEVTKSSGNTTEDLQEITTKSIKTIYDYKFDKKTYKFVKIKTTVK